jgi:hypothetical protein
MRGNNNDAKYNVTWRSAAGESSRRRQYSARTHTGEAAINASNEDYQT